MIDPPAMLVENYHLLMLIDARLTYLLSSASTLAPADGLT